jgi:hypothetical protein
MHGRIASNPRRAAGWAAAALVLGALALAVGACGEKKQTHVVEGEPIEIGNLQFNVQLTRFLNPSDPEDAEYLEGEQVPAPTGKVYLAVFMETKNESDSDVPLPTVDDMKVTDTTGGTYTPVDTNTVFGFPFGESLAGGAEIPTPDSAAASGPIKGSVVIFLVDQTVSENRPLELEVSANGAVGTIELDI